MVDTQATVDMLVNKVIWKNRKKCIYMVDNIGAVVDNAPAIICPNDNSNTDNDTPTKEVGDTVSVDGDTDDDVDTNKLELDATNFLLKLQDGSLMFHSMV
jgi:hypothetical protein